MLKLIRLLVVSLFALLLAEPCYSQKVTVNGKVIDENNEPVIGTTVMEKGTKNGVITKNDGTFKITVSKKNAILDFSYVGKQSKSVTLSGRTSIIVKLSDDVKAISEVVVTALGMKREAKSLGYAVSAVNSDALNAGHEQNPMEALSGKVAGVDISQTAAGPSGSTRVIIRGNSQLSGSNLPLYVIDGIIMDNTQQGDVGKWGGYDYGDVLSSINTDDIESISVLKGPSASALYGSRASNGVVLITTKSGSKNKKGIGVEFGSNLTFVSLLTQFDDYQRVYGQGRDGTPPLDQATAGGTTQTSWGGKLDPNLMIPIYNGELKPYGNINNNVLSFFRTGLTFNNNIAVTESSDKIDFRLSASDMRFKDIVPSSRLNRTTFMFKGSAKAGEHLSFDAQASYVVEGVNNRPALGDSPSNIGNSIIGLAPNFDQSWLASDYKDAYGRYNQWNSDDYRLNPYWVINEMRNKSSKNRLTALARVNYFFTKNLKLTAKATTDIYTYRITQFTPMYTPKVLKGAMEERTNHVYENNYEVILSYKHRFGDFDFSGFVGGNLMQYKYESFDLNSDTQVIPGLIDITNYSQKATSHILNRKEVRSLYGQASFGYKDIVYVDATLRNDVSSTLSKNNRSYWYPSVSGSLLLSNLINLKNTPISFAKLRTSWAEVGGDTDPYQLSLQYGLRDNTLNGTPLGEVATNVLPNYHLKPTSTYSYEIGVDIRFFDNRIGIDATYYNQTTKNQILSLPVSNTTAYSKAMINAGKIRNQGLEVQLSTTPIQTKAFSWDSNLNFAKNNNKVLSLHPSVDNYELAAARWANAYIYAQVGKQYGVIMGRKFARTDNGEIIFKNGLPTFTDDMAILGNGNYDFTLGWRNQFTFKTESIGTISISSLIDMKFGADVYSMSAMFSCVNGTSKKTLEGRDAWYASEQARLAKGESSENWVPTGGYVGKGVKAVADDKGNTTYEKNDVYVNPFNYWESLQENTPEPFIYDASYIKFRELSISYTLPKKWLTKTPFESVSFSAFGRNLFMLYSNLDNIDPESSYNNGNGQGFEYGSLPSRRTFGFGVNVKF
jgi:TonB-linked SusC/RagA family outer membrane protein